MTRDEDVNRLRRHVPVVPTALALLALFVALGGPGYAAARLAPGTVGTAQLKADAVTSAKIKNGAVKTTDLGADAVTSAKIKKGSVGATDLAPGAVPAQPTLRKGEVMSGHYASHIGVANEIDHEAISFPAALRAPLPESHLVLTDVDGAPHCPGVGRAESGYMCFYAQFNSGMSVYSTYGALTTMGTLGGTSTAGLTVAWQGAADTYTDGIWAVGGN